MKSRKYLQKFFRPQDRAAKAQGTPAKEKESEPVISVECVGSSAESPAHVSREVFYSGKIDAVVVTSSRLQ